MTAYDLAGLAFVIAFIALAAWVRVEKRTSKINPPKEINVPPKASAPPPERMLSTFQKLRWRWAVDGEEIKTSLGKKTVNLVLLQELRDIIQDDLVPEVKKNNELLEEQLAYMKRVFGGE